MQEFLHEHLDPATLVRAVLGGAQPGASVPWRRVVVRPVDLKGGRMVQIVRYDDHQALTANYGPTDVAPQLDELASMPFRHATIETSRHRIQARVAKRGQVLSSRTAIRPDSLSPDTAHDRVRGHVLRRTEPDAFLVAVGIMDERGQVRPAKQHKFRQINEFLRMLAVVEQPDDGRPLRVVDFGCGNGYLTFAAYHYFNDVRGWPTHVLGIDRDAAAIARNEARRAQLGWDQLEFRTSAIRDAADGEPADVVLSLHACDTATDDALAAGVNWNARWIFASPCCHHDIQAQMKRADAPTAYGEVLQHGILRERLGDVLTDSLRASILGLVGYQPEVMTFVSLDDTAKNILIRATRADRPPRPEDLSDYRALTGEWQLQPYLARVLAGRLPETVRPTGTEILGTREPVHGHDHRPSPD
jgi:SAM-dependent methyltransferase